MLQLFAGVSIAALGVAATSPITVVCNKDNTIDVTVDYDKPASVLEFSYGTCNKDTSRANFTQNSNNGWSFQLDVSACGMDNKLRTLEYNQTAAMRVGRVSGGTELTLAHFDIDSYCTYTSSYTVKFDYGTLSTESHEFESGAGLIDLTFSLKSYNHNYSAEATNSKKAGESVNLGLTITNKNFNHAADHRNSATGKVFAPQSCVIKDDQGQSYTLFDHAVNGCKNDDVDFSISFSQSDNMWRFSHMLFLIGNHRQSTLSLECTVIVCDRSKSTDCDAVVNACL
jgi:hypothetical protein